MNDDTQTTGVEAPTQAVDTAETQASEASVQVNDNAPEATQTEATAQEAEATEVKATDTAEESLYAGKYKSVEDMEKAYKELQSKATRDAQEKAELTKILNDAFLTPEADAPATVADTEETYGEEPSSVDPRIERLERQGAVSNFIMTHPDADGAAMNKVMTSDPLIASIQGHEARLEYAYLKSKTMSQPKAVEQARREGAQQVQAKTAEKQVAQVEAASQSSTQIDEKAELQERMASGNYEQREKARREYIRKYLV